MYTMEKERTRRPHPGLYDTLLPSVEVNLYMCFMFLRNLIN